MRKIEDRLDDIETSLSAIMRVFDAFRPYVNSRLGEIIETMVTKADLEITKITTEQHDS
jgi:hypothetical protein